MKYSVRKLLEWALGLLEVWKRQESNVAASKSEEGSTVSAAEPHSLTVLSGMTGVSNQKN